MTYDPQMQEEKPSVLQTKAVQSSAYAMIHIRCIRIYSVTIKNQCFVMKSE